MVSPVPGSGPASEGLFQFKLTPEQAAQLVKSADGMQGYVGQSGWENFPQRKESENSWGVGFSDSFEFQNGIFGARDGALSFQEAQLAETQLLYDRQAETRQWDRDENKPNPDPIRIDPHLRIDIASGELIDTVTGKPANLYDENGEVRDNALNAHNFYNQIFWNSDNPLEPGDQTGEIRAGLDRDGDGVFTEADINALAALDGDDQYLTEADFEAAAENPDGAASTPAGNEGVAGTDEPAGPDDTEATGETAETESTDVDDEALSGEPDPPKAGPDKPPSGGGGGGGGNRFHHAM